jgi:purine-cytosine permease-like protein
VVVYGTLLVAMGLNLWQSMIAIAVGAVSWVLAGLCSLSGPAAGTTAFTISRAPFGRNGMRPIALFNWLMQIGYEVLDLVMIVLAGSALLGMAGVHVGTGAKLALLVVFAIAQSLLPMVGHAAITRVLHWLIAPFAALFVVLAWLTADRLHVTVGHPAGWAALMGGIALSASGGGLGWASSGPDYSRYLPREASRGRIFAAVTIGGAVPQALLMLLGVGVALLTDKATDPVSGLPAVYPGWFLLPYLVLLIVQMLSLNAINLYSSGVTLQAIGLPVGRWQAVAVDGAFSALVGAIVVFSSSFNTVLSNFLLFMNVWLAPWTAVFILDYFLRRGRYDVEALDSAGSRFGESRAFGMPGLTAMAAGMAVALLSIDTTVYTGPLAKLCAGGDLSVPTGLIVAGVVYYVLFRRESASVPGIVGAEALA